MKRKDFSGAVSIKAPAPSEFNAIPDHPVSKIRTRQTVRELDINTIAPSPDQPRKVFREESLSDLSTSIKKKGVLQPITVKRVGEERFEIIFGERRWRASKLAGKETIPTIVREESDDGDEVRLIENIQREDLLPEDLAVAVNNVLEAKRYTQTDFGGIIGKSQAFISKCMKIADFALNEEVAAVILEFRKTNNFTIGFEHLFEAACKKTPAEGIEFLRNIVTNKLSVKAIRTISQKKEKEWHERNVMKRFRSIRGNLDFDFVKKANLGDKKENIVKEIDLTIKSFEDSIETLNKMKIDLT